MPASRGHRPQFPRSGCCPGAEASEAPQNHTILLGDEHLSGATARLSIILGQKNASLVSLNLVYSSWWSNPNTRHEANFIEFLLFKLSVCITLPTQDCKNPLLHFLLVDFRLICFV